MIRRANIARRARRLGAGIRKNPWDVAFLVSLILAIVVPIVGLTGGPPWLRFAYSPLILVMLITSEIGRRRDDRLERARIKRELEAEAGIMILDAFDRGYRAGGGR